MINYLEQDFAKLSEISYPLQNPGTNMLLPVISVLKSIFVRNGIPYPFLASNVPCNSQELNIFSKQYNFLLKISGSNYFQSTRLNEMNEIIAKKNFKKYKDPGLGLLG